MTNQVVKIETCPSAGRFWRISILVIAASFVLPVLLIGYSISKLPTWANTGVLILNETGVPVHNLKMTFEPGFLASRDLPSLDPLRAWTLMGRPGGPDGHATLSWSAENGSFAASLYLDLFIDQLLCIRLDPDGTTRVSSHQHPVLLLSNESGKSLQSVHVREWRQETATDTLRDHQFGTLECNSVRIVQLAETTRMSMDFVLNGETYNVHASLLQRASRGGLVVVDQQGNVRVTTEMK